MGNSVLSNKSFSIERGKGLSNIVTIELDGRGRTPERAVSVEWLI